jgi:hypothetical protein
MRYCLEEELSWYTPDNDGDYACYPDITQEIVPLLIKMIEYEHRKDGTRAKVRKAYLHWLGDLLSNYYDEGIYSPEEIGDETLRQTPADDKASHWVARLEALQEKLLLPKGG